jgi:CubicO group peptidase (beta-lactamase class C family)
MKLTPLLLLAAALASAARATPTSLPRGVPEEEGVDSAGVLSLVDALENNIDSVHSVMVLRHGKVVAEGWWNPYVPGDVHVLYSGTKSFVSTAVGFAAQEGLLSIDDLVLSFFPEYAPKEPAEQMKRMRIRDLLIMSSGHEKDTINRLRATKDGAWIRAFLALDVEHKPGTHFQYNSGGTYMLAAIVQKVTGKTVEAYLEPRLFAPLGIEQHPWALSAEGVDLGDGGLRMRTEDFAKFGQFYLQKGKWEGRQLLNEKWALAATSRQTSSGSDPQDNWECGYGYQFWMNPVGGFRADGANGQYSIVLPEKDLVVTITSGTADLKGVMNTVWAKLLPAVHDGALPPNPAALSALKKRLAELSLPPPLGSAHSAAEAGVSGKVYTFPENELGLTSAEVLFSSEGTQIAFTDADGRHVIACGQGAWTRGRTHFRKRITNIWDASEQGIAAAGAWKDTDTYVAKLWFDETPFAITAAFHFEGGELQLDMEHNVPWGAPKNPRVVGTAVGAAGVPPGHQAPPPPDA